ncbi:MAG: hypothetical protein B6U89_05520 [Desulfurococcales archaeon ex4484_58]|nr:MAG: hypothetical protein B6U89_05520 [Desulfurococcales archaeon ex4484_58]
MDILILKSMIEGIHLAVYSSIKPGAYHKLRFNRETEVLVSNTISVIDYIIQAIEYGERVRRGELAITNIRIGKLLAKAIRESYRWNGGRVYPSTIIPQIIYSVALSHSNIDSVIRDAGKLKKSLDLILGINDWREIRQIIDAFKSVHREDMYEHLVSTGLTQIAGIEGQVTFNDVFRVLSSKWVAFIVLDIYEYKVVELVKKLLEYYKKYGDAENSIVALYLDLIKNKVPDWAKKYIDEAFKKGLMASKEGAKKLFELDSNLRKNNISFNEYVSLLAMVSSLAIYEGMRP